MAGITSIHAEKCWHHLVNAHTASARRIYSSVRQFLIYSTFVFVNIPWQLLWFLLVALGGRLN